MGQIVPMTMNAISSPYMARASDRTTPMTFDEYVSGLSAVAPISEEPA